LLRRPDGAKKVSPVVLPKIDWVPTRASGSRNGSTVQRVVLHRWGVSYSSETAEALSYRGVIREFQNPKNQASAHIVFPGSAVPGKATQMVAWHDKAWTEAAYNPSSVEIEAADAVWLGKDPHGLAVLARMTAFLLHKYDLPPVHSAQRGFCRHGDLGTAGGGHTVCPVPAGAPIWDAFTALVKHEAARGGFLPAWGFDSSPAV
jgi:hypothetical protein